MISFEFCMVPKVSFIDLSMLFFDKHIGFSLLSGIMLFSSLISCAIVIRNNTYYTIYE